MTKIIVFESLGTHIREFKTNPKAKAKKIIGFKDWGGDRKKLRDMAEKHKETGGNELENRSDRS